MVREGECPPEEFGGGAPPPKGAAPVAPPAIPVAPAFPSFGGLIDVIRDIFAFLRGGPPVYIKAGTRPEIKQYTLTEAKVQKVTTIPADALEWELWNSNLGAATGTLDWGYVADFGATGTGTFNRLALDDRVSRKVAGVELYVRPANANQVAVLEVLRP